MSALLRRLLLYPSIVMAASAVGWSLTTTRLLKLPWDPAVHLLVFALAVLFYNRDRLAGHVAPDDRLNMAERTEWIARHRRALRGLVAAMAATSGLVLAARPAALPPILAGLGFALAYSMRLLPGGRAPRQLPGLKAPYVAALWVLLVVGAPLAAAGAPWTGRAGLIAVAIGALVAAQVSVNDIRDVVGDRLVGTQTFAVLWGERGARAAGLLAALLTGGVAVLLASAGLGLAALYTAGYTLTYRREADDRFRWIIEGAGLATWLGVVIADA